MTTASIPPEKLILLAAVGIGAYWFMNQRAIAAGGSALTPASLFYRNSAISPSQAGQGASALYAANDAKLWGSVGNLLGTTINRLTSTASSTPNAYQQANGRYNGVGSSNPSGGSTGDPYNSMDDTVAANPAPQYGSVWDYTQEYWY